VKKGNWGFGAQEVTGLGHCSNGSCLVKLDLINMCLK
jgi:hypothetical protein